MGKSKQVKLARLGGVSEEVLFALIKVGAATTDVLVSASIDAFLSKGFNDPHPPSKQIKQVINRLMDRHLLKLEDEKLTLTKQGHWELARRRRLDKPEYHVASKWDGKWRVVIFDIPELQRSQRDRLRRSFQHYGFYLLQQSVWVYPYRCDEFIRSLKQDLGFEAEVLYMLVEVIENQSKLEEEYGLA